MWDTLHPKCGSWPVALHIEMSQKVSLFPQMGRPPSWTTGSISVTVRICQGNVSTGNHFSPPLHASISIVLVATATWVEVPSRAPARPRCPFKTRMEKLSKGHVISQVATIPDGHCQLSAKIWRDCSPHCGRVKWSATMEHGLKVPCEKLNPELAQEPLPRMYQQG